VSPSSSVVTAEQLARFPDDEFRYELVDGRVHRMSPVGGVHGMLVVRLAAAIELWLQEHPIGVLLTETGFVLTRNPDTVRAPDLAFVRADRIPSTGVPFGFWPGAPDLAVEILSPDDSPSDVRTKVRDYLRRGVPLVWVIDPRAQRVTAYRPSAVFQTLAADGALDGGGVLPGFTYPLRRLFARP
jgi:Uma2 family endonuclease